MERTIESVAIPEEAEVIIEQVGTQLITAQSFAVATTEDYSLAGEKLKTIKTRAGEIDRIRKGMTQPLDRTKIAIMDFFRPAIDQLNQAENLIKRAMLKFQRAEEEKRQAEERRLQEIARKEQARIEKQQEERAQRWADKGNTEKAEEIRDSVPIIPIPVVQREMPKIAGVSNRQIWKFRIIDVSRVPCDFLIVNEKMLGDFARATKGTIAVPGIEFYSEGIIASGK